MEDPVSRTEPNGAGRRVILLENRLVDVLVERRWSIAAAESLTGGEITERLCTCPGTEDRVLGGIVAYATQVKRTVLGVTAPAVVSAEAAEQMATATRSLFAADVGLAVTGVAGPQRQEDQPVGTVFVGWDVAGSRGAVRLACAGTPDQIRRAAADEALRILLDQLVGAPDRPVT